MKSRTPFDSTVWSASVLASPSSIIRPYWKPEQPPPWTNTRRPASSLFSSVRSSVIFSAAVGVTLIMEQVYPAPGGGGQQPRAPRRGPARAARTLPTSYGILLSAHQL